MIGDRREGEVSGEGEMSGDVWKNSRVLISLRDRRFHLTPPPLYAIFELGSSSSGKDEVWVEYRREPSGRTLVEEGKESWDTSGRVGSELSHKIRGNEGENAESVWVGKVVRSDRVLSPLSV